MPRKTAPAAPYTLMTLACSALQVDADIQPRRNLNMDVLLEYGLLYGEDHEGQEPLPPLDVFQVGETYYVADGFHRLAAAKQVARQTVPCHVYPGTRRDAMIHGALANLKRGLAYNQGDKQRVLERLLADPEISQRGDRPLARDLGISHMTVWRTRARLAEEARLQAEIAALPATATAPKVREQEQLAAYLAVPVDTLKHSLGTGSLRYESPQAIIQKLASSTVMHSTPAPEAAAWMAKNVERAADLTSRPPSQTPRPSMSKEAMAERKEHARREELTFKLYGALEGLVRLYPFPPEEDDDPDYPLPPTAEELVAAVVPNYVEIIAERLTEARTVLDALCAAWEARTQETAASV